MNSQRNSWLIALGYVGFIYATLGIVRPPLAFLRSLGLLKITLGILYAGCLIFLLTCLFKTRQRNFYRYFVLTCISLTYFFVGKWLNNPEEQIHFFQYGLVGVLFFRALKHHFQSTWRVLVLALVLSTLAGWIDEIIQGILPSRHYDIRDIFLNFCSAFLGLMMYQFVLRTPSPKPITTT